MVQNHINVLKRSDFVNSDSQDLCMYRKTVPKRNGQKNHTAEYLINLYFCYDSNHNQEADYRLNNYIYLKNNQKINGVSKDRFNSLLNIGCPDGKKKCIFCSSSKGKKSLNKTKGMRKAETLDIKSKINDYYVL